MRLSVNYEYKKLLFFSLSCLLIAAAYAILRPLKITIFYSIVGKEYYPLSKLFMVGITIPGMLFYAKLVDKVKRHHILYIFFGIYICLIVFFAALFLHPTIGLLNTQTSPYRLLGWFFLAAMDFYPTFVIGTIWAFINSVSSPEFAKNNYGIIVASTKLGGIGAAGISLYATMYINHYTTIPILIIGAGVLLLLSVVVIRMLMKTIPTEYMTGYQEENRENAIKSKPQGMISGLQSMLTTPYVFGIFMLYYCYEVIFTIVEYQGTFLFSLKTNNSSLEMSSFLFFCMIASQSIGFVISLLGTSTMLRHLAMKYALLIMPASTVILAITIFFLPILPILQAALILLPALNFGFNAPIREMLYIPTTKDIQFKSKAWIDSFGRSLSKTSGSTVNMLFSVTTPATLIVGNTVLTMFIAGIWGITSYFMGRHYQETIQKKESIGNS